METNIFPLELLTNDNYADWSVKMKNNMVAQGLWDIVKTGSKPPKPDDDVVEFEAWIKMNDAALHAIQSSCGIDILSRINKISSSEIAWKMLGKMVMESNGHDKLMQTEDDLIIDEGNSLTSNNPGTEANQGVESENSSDNQGRSKSSNISDNGHDKLIQTTKDDNSITNEENSSSSNNSGTERDDYAALLKAVSMGDWNRTREFLELHPHALTARMTTFLGGTVLHAAVDAEQEHIVGELVNMISEQDLEIIKDGFGNTALHQTAMNSGNYRVAECLIRKNKRLANITNDNNDLPVSLAMGWGNKELARYLYSQTLFEDLEAEEGRQGASLFNYSLETRDLDTALDLMERCPSLAFAMDGQNVSPFEKLAVATDAFESTGKGMVFWKQWIYNHCIHINSSTAGTATDQVRLNINQNGQEKTIVSVRADLWRKLASSLLNLFGFKHLYEMKLARHQFQQLLSRMCEAIPTNTSPENRYETIAPIIFHAIRRGNFEFVYQIVKANSDLLLIGDVTYGRSIFQCAVLHRQHRIFSLIYSLKNKNVLLNAADNFRNTILHMAGMLTEHTPIDHIRGAALQMQREAQWFKEVERICPLACKEYLNKDGLTPKQLFTVTHQKLKKEGEQWMKETATSCSLVGALIVTIMFAAAFTIPGGNNQDTGLPILMHDKLLKIFLVNDSLSLFSSSTSVLMFLGILTARYAEEDFLKSLPKRMIIGLFTLFFSITTMMIAFSAALLLIFRGQLEFVIPIISLAGVPIVLFALMQFRLLVDMYVATYCTSSIFNRKTKPWL